MKFIIKRYKNKKLVSKKTFSKVIEIKFYHMENNSQLTIYFKQKEPYIFLIDKNEYLKICEVENKK